MVESTVPGLSAACSSSNVIVYVQSGFCVPGRRRGTAHCMDMGENSLAYTYLRPTRRTPTVKHG